jgi:protein-tyrosine phosphatase
VIDLHCHILPTLDDGPLDPEGSLALARELVADGVRTVAATPHLRSDYPWVLPGELAQRCRDLRALLADEGLTLEIVAAGEADLVWALSASVEELRLVSYAQRGTDLLLECPYGLLPSTFDELVLGIAGKGFRVLLAHPERNPSFQQDRGRLAALVRRGVLVQVTADALLRPRRSRSGRLARTLVREGLAHVLSSDAHALGSPERAPLSAGVAAAAKLAPGRGEWMVTEAPAAVLAGEPLAQPPPGRPRRLPLVDRLRR